MQTQLCDPVSHKELRSGEHRCEAQERSPAPDSRVERRSRASTGNHNL